MADGSVRFISETVSDEVFKALVTMKGGEQVDVGQHTTEVPSGKREMTTKPDKKPPVDKKPPEEKQPTSDKPDKP